MSFIRGFLVRRRTEDIFFINLCCMNRQAMKKVYSRIEAARNIGRRWRGLGSMDPSPPENRFKGLLERCRRGRKGEIGIPLVLSDRKRGPKDQQEDKTPSCPPLPPTKNRRLKYQHARRLLLYGTPPGTRTPDTLIKSQVLLERRFFAALRMTVWAISAGVLSLCRLKAAPPSSEGGKEVCINTKCCNKAKQWNDTGTSSVI